MVLAFTFYLQPPDISTSHTNTYMHAPSHTYSFCLSRYKWEARSGREKFTKFLFRKVNPTRWEDGKTKCIFLIWEFVSSFYAYVLVSALLCVVCLFGAFFWKEKKRIFYREDVLGCGNPCLYMSSSKPKIVCLQLSSQTTCLCIPYPAM